QLFGAANRPIYELKIPDLGVDATPLQGNGATVTLSDGRSLVLSVLNLNYSLFGAWSLSPQAVGGSASTANLGIGISGYQTPAAAVPTGTATYASGSGGVAGFAATPAGTGSLSGQASIGVNFSTGAVSGSLTGMTVTPAGGSAAAWNSVSLNGSLSGSSLSGTTAASGAAPGGTMAFDASSTGTFNGALFGPNGQELGAVWSLHDATGQGKSAIGYIGATKQ
ncbi:MAG: transferrin-binding protein-like solute binding protein, partial [Rhizomicrobium sp.]